LPPRTKPAGNRVDVPGVSHPAQSVDAFHGGMPRTGRGLRPSVCMINFNGAEYLRASLDALMGIEAFVAEILLVDNASTDGSRELVETHYPSVRVVALDENRGAAAARNVALSAARSDVVLLLDNDVTLAEAALGRLLEALGEDPSVVAAMPAIVYAGDRETVQYDGADAHFLGQQLLHDEGVPYETLPMGQRDLGSVVSACLVVHRGRLQERAGGAEALATFDEDFFIYFEDHDFGYRMRALGLRVVAVPLARCFHEAGTPGLSIRVLGSYSALRVFCHIRNRWLFIAKNYSLRTLAVLAPMLVGYEVLQFAASARKGWLAHWARAAGWMIRHPRRLAAKRRQVQRARRVSDGELLKGGAVPLRREAIDTPLERAAKRLLDVVAGGYWRLTRGLL